MASFRLVDFDRNDKKENIFTYIVNISYLGIRTPKGHNRLLRYKKSKLRDNGLDFNLEDALLVQISKRKKHGNQILL